MHPTNGRQPHRTAHCPDELVIRVRFTRHSLVLRCPLRWCRPHHLCIAPYELEFVVAAIMMPHFTTILTVDVSSIVSLFPHPSWYPGLGSHSQDRLVIIIRYAVIAHSPLSQVAHTYLRTSILIIYQLYFVHRTRICTICAHGKAFSCFASR
jgi:hypothetical protein